MEDVADIDLHDDRIRGGDDVDRRRRVRQTGKGFAEKEACRDLGQDIAVPPVIFLDDVDRPFQDQSDIGDGIAGIKEEFPFLIFFLAYLQALQERQDIGFGDAVEERRRFNEGKILFHGKTSKKKMIVGKTTAYFCSIDYT